MDARKRVFIFDFTEPIKKFRHEISREDLPTIDVDMVMAILFEAFEKPNFATEIDNLALRLLEGDWLIENPAWCNKNEEVYMKRYLYQSIHDFAWGMYRMMEEQGLFFYPETKYAYKRMLNDYTLTFTQLS
jgi:hypothetical protein